MPITYSEAKPYERAARIYCESVGDDPDRIIEHSHPVVEGVTAKTPNWVFIAESLIDLSRMLIAIKRAEREQAEEMRAVQ